MKEIEIPNNERPGRVRTKVKLTEDGYTEEMMYTQDIVPCVVEKSENDAKEAAQRTEALLKRAQEAYDAIDYLLTNIPKPLEAYTSFVKEALGRVRDQKMALESETRGLMSSLREVREFFLEDKHAREVARLLEFVELCERLKRLRDSGFLDAIADTMLKLAEH